MVKMAAYGALPASAGSELSVTINIPSGAKVLLIGNSNQNSLHQTGMSVKIDNRWYSAINGGSHDEDAYSLSFSGSTLTVTTEDSAFDPNTIVYVWFS